MGCSFFIDSGDVMREIYTRKIWINCMRFLFNNDKPH